ncbi:MAG: hypothetical protein LBH44_03900 [Treponema sp.]|nr:hypothetical protein [Treponema sp.]
MSGLPTVWIDDETQTVKSHGKGGHAGLIYYYREYKWEYGQLMLMCSENQDYDEELDAYIRITRTLQNGVWIEQTETVWIEDL